MSADNTTDPTPHPAAVEQGAPTRDEPTKSEVDRAALAVEDRQRLIRLLLTCDGNGSWWSCDCDDKGVHHCKTCGGDGHTSLTCSKAKGGTADGR